MKNHQSFFALLLVSVALMIGSAAHAQTNRTWNGAGGNDNWSTGANWGGVAPSSGNALTFAGTVRLSSVNDLAADSSIAGITYSAGGGAFVVTGNRITLTSNVTNSSSNLQTLNLDMILSAQRTFNTATANVTTNGFAVGGILSGVGGLTKSSTGNSSNGLMTLTGANTYTGSTIVNGGTLEVSGAVGTLQNSSSINVGVTAGSGASTAVLRLSNAAGNANRLGDAAPVTLHARGELALIGNTTTATTETFGALTLGSGTYSTAPTITLSGTAAGLLTLVEAASWTRTNRDTALIRGTNLGQQSTNATRFTLADISGLTFIGTTTANGTTPGSAKDVRIVPYLIGDTSATGNGAGFVTYDTTGGLRPLGANEYVTLSAGYTAPVAAENVRAFNGSLTTPDQVVNSLLFNTASQTLDGTGTLTVQSGAIAAVANNSVLGAGFSEVTLGNGTWNEAVLTATSGSTLTVNSRLQITGGAAGALVKSGAGTVVLAGNNAFDAVTYVNQGVLRVTHNNGLGSTVGGVVVHGLSGGKLEVGGGITVADAITIFDRVPHDSSAFQIVGGANTFTGAITYFNQQRWVASGNGSATFTGGVINGSATAGLFVMNPNAGSTFTFSNTPMLLGASSLYLDTTGLVVIAVAGNTWTQTSIAGGTIRTDIVNGIPANSDIRIGVGYSTSGTLDLNGYSQVASGLHSGTTTAGTRTVTSATPANLTLNGTTNRDFDGQLTGALGLIKQGTYTQTLSGTSTHTGDTRVEGGTLALANVNALQNSTLDTAVSGAQQVTFTVAGTNTYNLGGLKGTDALAIGANSLVLGSNGQSTSFSGALSGTGGIQKVGTGATSFSGNSTYSGGTTITAGTFLADSPSGQSSTGTGAVTVGSAGTLGGTGYITTLGTSNVTISGTLAPGSPSVNDGIGNLNISTVNGSVIFETGSEGLFELKTNGNNGLNITFDSNGFIDTIGGSANSGSSDRLLFSSTGSGTIDFSTLSPLSLSVVFGAGYMPALYDAFDLLDWSNATGLAANQLKLPDLSTHNPSWFWDDSKFTSHGVIAIGMAVPEPSRALLLLMGTALMLTRRRRCV